MVVGEQRVALDQRVEVLRGVVELPGLELGVRQEEQGLLVIGRVRMLAQVVVEALGRRSVLLEAQPRRRLGRRALGEIGRRLGGLELGLARQGSDDQHKAHRLRMEQHLLLDKLCGRNS